MKEITNISLKQQNSSEEEHAAAIDDVNNTIECDLHADSIVQNRSFMQKHCLRSAGTNKKKKNCRYALKVLQAKSFTDASTFVNGVVDLAVEARFLSVIRHGHIIKMRGMLKTEHYFSPNFFVILDRLYDILPTRIAQWKKMDLKSHSLLSRMQLSKDKRKIKELAFWLERIHVAHDLAGAIRYLHEQQYVVVVVYLFCLLLRI